MEAVMYNEFREDNVNFDGISKNKKGGKMIKMSYGPSKRPIMIQTPTLALPFGLSRFDDDVNGVQYSFDARLDDRDDRCKELMDRLRGLERVVIDHVKPLRKELFGGSIPEEHVMALFKSPIRSSSKPEYPPLLKIKIPAYATHFYNAQREEIEMNDFVGKGQEVKFIILISSVWFVGRSFGISCKLSQALQVKGPMVSSFGFRTEDEDMATDIADSAARPPLQPQLRQQLVTDFDNKGWGGGNDKDLEVYGMMSDGTHRP
jgi:hypothetical protein